MTVPNLNPASRLSWAFYIFAFGLILTPVIDVAANVWPPNVGLPEWRYGMIGTMSNYILTPVLAMVLAAATAQWQDHRTTLRTLAVVCLVGAALLGAALLTFILDVIEVRQAVVIGALAMFKTGAIKASYKLGSAAVFLLVLAAAQWRAGAPDVGTLAEASPADVNWRPQSPTETT